VAYGHRQSQSQKKSQQHIISAVISRGNVDRKIQGTPSSASKDTPREKKFPPPPRRDEANRKILRVYFLLVPSFPGKCGS